MNLIIFTFILSVSLSNTDRLNHFTQEPMRREFRTSFPHCFGMSLKNQLKPSVFLPIDCETSNESIEDERIIVQIDEDIVQTITSHRSSLNLYSPLVDFNQRFLSSYILRNMISIDGIYINRLSQNKTGILKIRKVIRSLRSIVAVKKNRKGSDGNKIGSWAKKGGAFLLLALLEACELVIELDEDEPKESEPSRFEESLYTKLPDDVTKLFKSIGNKDADIVWIFEQGGPIHEIDVEYNYSGFEGFPGRDEILFVTVHQTLTFNNKLASHYKRLTPSEIQDEIDVSLEMLHRTIKHFKKQGKEVILFGHSYGAFLITRYLWKKGSDAADAYIIASGRLDMPRTVAEGFSSGEFYFFPDAVNPQRLLQEDPKNDQEFIEVMFAGETGRIRHTKKLAHTDLSKVIYLYGANDMTVGRLTKEEIEFLVKQNAYVIPVIGTDVPASLRMPESEISFLYDILDKDQIIEAEFGHHGVIFDSTTSNDGVHEFPSETRITIGKKIINAIDSLLDR